jgi:hypothetical protein
VLFTNKEDCVVISDKAGDVYRLEYELESGYNTYTPYSIKIYNDQYHCTSAPGYQLKGYQ